MKKLIAIILILSFVGTIISQEFKPSIEFNPSIPSLRDTVYVIQTDTIRLVKEVPMYYKSDIAVEMEKDRVQRLYTRRTIVGGAFLVGIYVIWSSIQASRTINQIEDLLKEVN
jgi:hypothetical protein